ncbi:uncharacterized protein BJ171DRAFT_599131 [Polychytrium aggregatum]|uniref:uncharacterized protein n=1 Tax=Polychytrium aggregatum TaxID=110093 RepID=UPI0022FEB03D|nr:uncharacterized protein BJ171DRAFT_599131 [Polychytrium aggregatum]KAI9204730.1 hypothetical protein BJ171DRAFT_599131 [Polychytrium aggregatum]
MSDGTPVDDYLRQITDFGSQLRLQQASLQRLQSDIDALAKNINLCVKEDGFHIERRPTLLTAKELNSFEDSISSAIKETGSPCDSAQIDSENQPQLSDVAPPEIEGPRQSRGWTRRTSLQVESSVGREPKGSEHAEGSEWRTRRSSLAASILSTHPKSTPAKDDKPFGGSSALLGSRASIGQTRGSLTSTSVSATGQGEAGVRYATVLEDRDLEQGTFVPSKPHEDQVQPRRRNLFEALAPTKTIQDVDHEASVEELDPTSEGLSNTADHRSDEPFPDDDDDEEDDGENTDTKSESQAGSNNQSDVSLERQSKPDLRSKSGLSSHALSGALVPVPTSPPKPLDAPPAQPTPPPLKETKTRQKHPLKTFIYKEFVVPHYSEFAVPYTATELKSKVESAIQAAPRFPYIHCMSFFRVCWDFFLSLTHILMVMIIPVLVSFEKLAADTEYLSFVLTAMYFVDLLLDFYTVQLVDGVAVSLAESRTMFIKHNLVLSLVTMLPFDIILENTIQNADTLLLLKLLKIFPFSKIVSQNPIYHALSKGFQRITGVGVSFMSIFLFGGLLLVFIHLHACSIFLMGRLMNYSTPTWNNFVPILNKDVGSQYTWAVFTAISNTFPVTGPFDPVEQWVTIFSVLIGAILYASLVGTISSFSFGLDSSGRMFKQKMDEVNEYMTYKKLTDTLKSKVKQYYELKYRGKFFDEVSIMDDLNESLRQEISIHNCRDLIKKVPFLNRNEKDGRDEMFLGRIANALRAMYFIQGDTIFEQGRVGNEMYFILSGNVDIVVNGNPVGSLGDGAFFGEVALLGQVPRTATIRAKTNATLYCFDRADFDPILADFEDMALRIKQVYQERMLKIKKENEEKLRKQEELTKMRVLPHN